MDIAMLFCNAGYSQCGAYQKITFEDVHRTVTTNTLHPAYTIKVLVDQMYNRKQRSAIVISSSIAALRPSPAHLIYACSKTFATYLGKGLNYELKDKIDVLAW